MNTESIYDAHEPSPCESSCPNKSICVPMGWACKAYASYMNKGVWIATDRQPSRKAYLKMFPGEGNSPEAFEVIPIEHNPRSRITERSLARARGDKHYQDPNSPCKYCGGILRYTGNTNCVPCNAYIKRKARRAAA